ncbi:MAG: hypothetical protein K8S94_09735 [Planctomycetia bacterium]|nr:hypothetical protein [Planctomycetia bacterium]
MPQPDRPRPDVLALDVGGANLKAADGRGWTHSEPFAMWREWQRLPDALTQIIGAASPRRVVATMTGEIADCFVSRAAGVNHIVSAIVAAAEACDCGEPGIYLTSGRIVPPSEAGARPLEAAASNWHALARLAAAHVTQDCGVLIDIGSTTTDVVPLLDRRPAPLARDDPGRMLSGELVYTGIERTPLPALVRSLPHGRLRRPVASERFADSRDVWLLLGELTESGKPCDTADGGPLTVDAARIRIARSMLVEPAELTVGDAVCAARWCAEVQSRAIARAIDRVARTRGWRPREIVISGHGERLARMALARLGWTVDTLSLPTTLGAAVSRSAPAHALALIAREDLP